MNQAVLLPLDLAPRLRAVLERRSSWKETVRAMGRADALGMACAAGEQLADPDGQLCRSLGSIRADFDEVTEIAAEAIRLRVALEDLASLEPDCELYGVIADIDQAVGDALDSAARSTAVWRRALAPHLAAVAIRRWIGQRCPPPACAHVDMKATLADGAGQEVPAVDHIEAWLAKRSPSALVVAGPQGSGRTSVLCEVLRRWREQPHDGILLVPMMDVMQSLGDDSEHTALERVRSHVEALVAEMGGDRGDADGDSLARLREVFHVVVVADGFAPAMQLAVVDVVRQLAGLVDAGISVLASCERLADPESKDAGARALNMAVGSLLVPHQKKGKLIRLALPGLTRTDRDSLLALRAGLDLTRFRSWMGSLAEDHPLLTCPGLFQHALAVLERGGFQRSRDPRQTASAALWLIEETLAIEEGVDFERKPQNVLRLSRVLGKSDVVGFVRLLTRTPPAKLGVIEAALWSWINYRLIRGELREATHSRGLFEQAERRFSRCLEEVVSDARSDGLWLTICVLRETAVLLDTLDKTGGGAHVGAAARALAKGPARGELGKVIIAYYGGVERAFERLGCHLADPATYAVMLPFDVIEIWAVAELARSMMPGASLERCTAALRERVLAVRFDGSDADALRALADRALGAIHALAATAPVQAGPRPPRSVQSQEGRD